MSPTPLNHGPRPALWTRGHRLALTVSSALLALLALLVLLRPPALLASAAPPPDRQAQAAGCSTVTAVAARECDALVEFYSATNGAGWLSNTNWLIFDAAAPCTWYGVACSGGRVAELILPANHLSGTLPTALGSLTGLTRLHLENNALSGRIPPSICNLTATLTDASLAYNALFSRSISATRCATQIDGDWRDTQTTPVTDLQPTEFYTNAVRLAWTPIHYTGDGGYYEIAIGAQRNGPFTRHGQTSGKDVDNYLVDGLAPGQSYFFAVRTVTPAHDEQPDALTSAASFSAGATLAAGGERVLVAAYFPADNDLAPEINYVVERLRRGTALNPNVQVVLLVDGARDDDTRMMAMSSGAIKQIDAVMQRWGVNELDTADPAVLTWFLQYARTRYPAQREVAALMGHGISAVPELSWATAEVAAAGAAGKLPPLPKEHEFTPSDITSGSFMSTVSLGEALLAATAQGSDPFDVIFFDQCFQGSIDILYEVAAAAHYFVASPNYAWLVAAYDRYLIKFTPSATPEELATSIINGYEASLDQHHPNSIFAVKASDIAGIAAAISNLGDALGRALHAGENDRIAAAVQQGQYVDTTQCSRQNLELGPPDELIGADSFAQKLQESFGAGDSAGVYAAADALRGALQGVKKQVQTGSPYLAPDEFWDYRDAITLLAPLPRNSPALVAWHASIYRGDAPFAARWAIDPSQPVTITRGLAFVRDQRWDEFLHAWFTGLTPTVGAWCNYSPPEQVLLSAGESITLTAVLSGADAIRLTWTPVDDSSASETRLYVVRPNAIGWNIAASFPASQTTAMLSGLAPGAYRLGLLARDTEFAGVARSNDLTVTVPAALPPTPTPTLYLPWIGR